MGGVPVKHHSKGKVGRRRSHLALKKTHIFVCESCKAPKLPHRTCPYCGAFTKKERVPREGAPVEEQAPTGLRLDEVAPATQAGQAPVEEKRTPITTEVSQEKQEEEGKEESKPEKTPQEST